MANVNGGLVSQRRGQNIQQMVHPKNILANENMKKKFTEILGKKAPGFMASIISLYNSDTKFERVDGYSVVNSALLAATLDLPINKEFGFAWIIPYGSKAQFQVGYKGYIQLALRTGQYKHLNVIEVFDNQLKSFNPLTEEIELDFTNDIDDGSKKIVGYAFYMQLLNGFEKTIYWSREKVLSHAQRFSKTFKNGPWQTDFNEMAKKTVLKNGLTKWGILSVEMQKAIEIDQATVEKEVTSLDQLAHQDLVYPDNPENKAKDDTAATVQEEKEDAFKDTPFENQVD